MPIKIGVRELRQNASRYLAEVKRGEIVIITERGNEIGRIVPSGGQAPRYADLASKLGASVPTTSFAEILGSVRTNGAPAGTADALLEESRSERV